MFQSTHSLRSATRTFEPLIPQIRVSIHALLAECDKNMALKESITTVSIHALLAECDGLLYHWRTIKTVSIHALLAECDNLVILGTLEGV